MKIDLNLLAQKKFIYKLLKLFRVVKRFKSAYKQNKTKKNVKKKNKKLFGNRV